MRCTRSILSAATSTTSPTTAARATSASGSCELWRADIDALYRRQRVRAPRSLAAPVKTFGLRREDFLAVIDGMEMDVVADIRAPDWATLDLYCDRVASAVGRLCVRVFGMEEKAGIALAHHLGRALQLTNILRDLDEDAAIGRLYLPREALRARRHREHRSGRRAGASRLGKACEPVVARAREHFAEADRIMAKCRAQHGARAAHHVGGLPGDPAQAGHARLGARRAAGEGVEAAPALTILRYAFI